MGEKWTKEPPPAALIRLIRHHRYAFTELRPGGHPGDRGHSRWGLTEPQLAAIVAGQARQPAAPVEPSTNVQPGTVRRLPPGGKSRLKLRRHA